MQLKEQLCARGLCLHAFLGNTRIETFEVAMHMVRTLTHTHARSIPSALDILKLLVIHIQRLFVVWWVQQSCFLHCLFGGQSME